MKTTLTNKTLFESLEMFHEISLPGYKSSVLPIFKGIYAFESGYRSTSGVAKSIYDFYNKPYFHEEAQKEYTRDILYLFHEITSVAALNRHCVFTKYAKARGDNSNMIPKLFSIRDEKELDIQTAMFLSLMFEYLDVEPYAKKSSGWNSTRLMGISTAIKHEENLTADDWFPRSKFKNEHDFTQESIRRRLNSFDDWFSGDISTRSVIEDIIQSDHVNENAHTNK